MPTVDDCSVGSRLFLSSRSFLVWTSSVIVRIVTYKTGKNMIIYVIMVNINNVKMDIHVPWLTWHIGEILGGTLLIFVICCMLPNFSLRWIKTYNPPPHLNETLTVRTFHKCWHIRVDHMSITMAECLHTSIWQRNNDRIFINRVADIILWPSSPYNCMSIQNSELHRLHRQHVDLVPWYLQIKSRLTMLCKPFNKRA